MNIRTGESEEQLDVIDVMSGAKGKKQEVNNPKKLPRSRT
jgi:hypothetical protein